MTINAENVCVCSSVKNIYPINPEGLEVVFGYSFTANPGGGVTYSGSNYKKNQVKPELLEFSTGQPNLAVETNVYGIDGTLLHTFEPGKYVTLSLGQMLYAAGVSLDDLAPLEEGIKGAISGHPHNRLIGVALEMDIKIQNYGTFSWRNWANMHDVVSTITIRRHGTWCSMGSETIDYQTPILNTPYTRPAPKSTILTYETQMTQRYRQGLTHVLEPNPRP